MTDTSLGADAAASFDAFDWAAKIASGESIDAPVAIIVAHPDDETLFTGSALARLRDVTLVLLTDGAPHDMTDARRLGYATREAYAQARAGELDRALDALGFSGRLIRYELPDQDAIAHVGAVLPRLLEDTTGAVCVLAHAYEGGHPDHDAAALLASHLPQPVVEFASYALIDDERVWARFSPGTGPVEQTRALSSADTARVERALAAHASQAGVFDTWRPTIERWRAAPTYRFDEAPPGEGCLFDRFGWTMTSDRWRTIARGQGLA